MYQFPENITDRRLAEEVLSGRRCVALYGRYPFGESYVDELIDAGVRITALFDSSYFDAHPPRSLHGIPVSAPEKLEEYRGILVICGNGYYFELEEAAKRRGVTLFLPYYFLYSGRTFTMAEYQRVYQIGNVARTHFIRREYPETVFINSLELAITHRCTLNCEKCANMISYFEHPADADFESMKDAVCKILEADIYISELRILGGEPLLNQELVKYLDLISQFDNVGLISIMTNGTILPSPELIRRLRDRRVYVTISNYGALSKNLSAITDMFDAEHILYRVYEMDGWRDCNSIEYVEMDLAALERKYRNCSVNNCYTLHNGRLYRCPYNAGVSILQAVPEEMLDFLRIDSLESEQVGEAMQAFMQVTSSQICKFCKGRPKGVVDIEAAKQARGKHPYKKYGYNKER